MQLFGRLLKWLGKQFGDIKIDKVNKTEFNKLNPSRQKMEMISFCLKNGVKIYPQALSGTKCVIVVDKEGETPKQGKEVFNTSKRRKEKEPKWEKAIEKGYEYYYNKLNKNE